MNLLESYLYFLYLQEREWDEPTENPDSFDINKQIDMIAKLGGVAPMKKIRHSLQPSLYSIYIKHAVGDYKGRIGHRNSRGLPHLGIDDFKKDAAKLAKKVKDAGKLKDKYNSSFKQNIDLDEPAI